MSRLYKFGILFSAIALLGQGCISFQRGGGRGADGGVFKSQNSGEVWQQKVAIPTSTGIRNFAGVNIHTFAIDPQDHLAIYTGTKENGLFYSFDGGDSWHQPKDITAGFVAAIAIDPADKCTIYVATGNRILKSTDCNRTFAEIYREPSAQTFITALTINSFNPLFLYAGTANGTLLRSRDAGRTWALEYNFQSRITDIVVDPRNSSTRLLTISGRGLWKTDNDGAKYVDISEGLRQHEGASDARRLIADRATANAFLLASRSKFLRSTDGGLTWTPLPIISPSTVEISALAVNPKSSAQIYYGTATTFYKTSDGGRSWSTKKLPSARTATAMLVDFDNPQTIYLGMATIKQ